MEFLKDKEYLGTVQDMHLNGDYCAVRFDGKILLHVLEGNDTIKIRLVHIRDGNSSENFIPRGIEESRNDKFTFLEDRGI